MTHYKKKQEGRTSKKPEYTYGTAETSPLLYNTNESTQTNKKPRQPFSLKIIVRRKEKVRTKRGVERKDSLQACIPSQRNKSRNMNHQFPSAADLGRNSRSQRQLRTQPSSQRRQQFQNPNPNPYATSTRAVTASASNPASSQRNNYYNNSNQMLRNIQQETVSSSAFQQQNLQSRQASRRNDSNNAILPSQTRPSLYTIRSGINRSLPREIEEDNDEEQRRREESKRPEHAPSSPHNSSDVSMKSTESGSDRISLEGVNDDDHHDTDPTRTEEETEEEHVSVSEKSADLEDVSSVSNHGSEQQQHCQHSSMKRSPESKSSEWKLYALLILLGLACIGLIVGFVVAAAAGEGSGNNSSSYSEEEQAKAVENFKLNVSVFAYFKNPPLPFSCLTLVYFFSDLICLFPRA